VPGDLHARLKRLRVATEGRKKDTLRPSPGAAPVTGDPGIRCPPGWRRHSDLVYSNETFVPLEGVPTERFLCRLLGREAVPDDLVFMDTETTGLSGGAGTTVFLVGSGRITRGGMRVTQVLLGDYPGEPEFLQHVERILDSPVWVSYNGRAFDVKLLETRFLMNGRQPLSAVQLDLLFWARRAFRSRIGACSLDDLEREVLHEERGHDIPGIEIPDRYFAYLRTADPSLLNDVVTHHLQDIASLGSVFLRLEDLLRDMDEGNGIDGETADRINLARFALLRERSHAGAEAVLRSAIFSPVAPETIRDRERAAAALASAYRFQGKVHELVPLFSRLWSEGSSFGGLALAKHLEHRERDYLAARRIVCDLLEASDTGDRAALEHRLKRLEEKAGRA
jgi:uncharacterized protein YprB with RNaseH-like and TPR domain